MEDNFMSLLIIILRKMFKNKWLYLCLLAGLIISVALISSIPLHTEGILNRLLIKDLENFQIRNKRYPGSYSIFYSLDEVAIKSDIQSTEDSKIPYFNNEKVINYYNEQYKIFKKLDEVSTKMIVENLPLPIQSSNVNYSTNARELSSLEKGDWLNSNNNYAKLQSLSKIEDHIKIIHGNLPSKEVHNGVYEVMITKNVLINYDLSLNHVYELIDTEEGGFETIKVKPVCVFTSKDKKDPYWINQAPESYFYQSFVINEELMLKEFINGTPTMIKTANWNFILDYHCITTNKLANIASTFEENSEKLTEIYNNVDFLNPCIDVINSYFDRLTQINAMLFVLNVPVVIMLALYTFMLCKLIVSRDRNEISLLYSRGANTLQIIFGYVILGLILGLLALIIGPLIGLLLSRVLGSSSGFLEFVNRKGIVTHLNKQAYINGFLVVLSFLIILLIPVYSISNISIVDHKKKLIRNNQNTLWKRLFIDFILLIISAYGYYIFTQRQFILRLTGGSASDFKIEPILFFVPPLFILGLFLFILRLYPFIIKGVYTVGKKIWSPITYAALIQVSRETVGYNFIMIFLTLSLSVGIFSATAARTININAEEKIRYKNGADIVLTSLWENDAASLLTSHGTQNENGSPALKIHFAEPPFSRYTELSGVEFAAKVFTKEKGSVSNSNNKVADNVTIMGLEPYNFGKTSWFRNSLLKYHINKYLNALASYPMGCLISKSLSAMYNIKVGENVKMSWNNMQDADFTVIAIIDYWPTFNPNKGSNTDEEPKLFVANLSYIQYYIGIEPYDVWLKLKEDSTTSELYESITKSKLPVINILNTNQDIIDIKTSPFLLVINSALSLGFVLNILICFMGFLLYWVIEVNSRAFQFGILRAMGLRFRDLISMIAWEQILTSGTAIACGMIIGVITSNIFVPFFQMSFDAAEQVPPFKVILFARDISKIMLIVSTALISELFLLAFFISKLKIDQTIKLGEN
jgi:putative ABC transport system permease protein